MCPAADNQNRAYQPVGRPVPSARGRKGLSLQAYRQKQRRHGQPQPCRPAEHQDDEHLQLAEEGHQTACGRAARCGELLGAHAQSRKGRHVRPDVRQNQGRLSRQDCDAVQEKQSEGVRFCQRARRQGRRRRQARGLAAVPAQTLGDARTALCVDSGSCLAAAGGGIRSLGYLRLRTLVDYGSARHTFGSAYESGGYRSLQLAFRQTAQAPRHFQDKVQGRTYPQGVRHHGNNAYHTEKQGENHRAARTAGGLSS